MRNTRHIRGSDRHETPPGNTRSTDLQPLLLSKGRQRRCIATYNVVAARCCKIACGYGERNSTAQIFHSSCSRSLEIASGHYGRLLVSSPYQHRAPFYSLVLFSPYLSFLLDVSHLFLCRSFAFFLFVPLPSLTSPHPAFCLFRFLSVCSRLL